jgi:hypothetical protein
VVDTQVPRKNQREKSINAEGTGTSKKEGVSKLFSNRTSLCSYTVVHVFMLFIGASIFKLQKTGLSDWEQKNSGACVDVACAT